jgi:hypothetical protein
MTETKKRESLSHPDFGELPVVKVLECIFALAPDGVILHRHLEELDTVIEGDEVLYTISSRPPEPGRERCRIIPPLARAFER